MNLWDKFIQKLLLKKRQSCFEKLKCKIYPTIKKIQLLKKAWDIKWNKQNHFLPNPRIKNNMPICLSVEIAINFLKSISIIDLKPATKIVKKPIKKINFWKEEKINKK